MSDLASLYLASFRNAPFDTRPDGSGLDDGPSLPPSMGGPRKKAAPKPADEMASIRARAWKTRRAKYGRYGHR